MQIKGIAQNLAEYMAKLSLKYYSDRWMVQLEYELWKELVEEPEMLEESEIKKLKDLRDMTEGWIMMNYDSGELEFMPITKWRAFYDKNAPF
ncbi:MAG: hypothetical protein RRB13_05850 [bacterium]|nr:hypothetical protein [bacterium]